MTRTIVVPLDGSELSEECLPCLGLLAAAHDVKVQLVTVKEVGDDRATVAELQTYLDSRASSVHQLFGLATTTRVKEGVPYVRVIEETLAENTALVVLSTHGRGQAGDDRVGSVADQIIRSSGCPALVVGPHCQPFATGVERLIIPLDGSPLAETVLTIVGALANSLHAVVELVRVVETDDDGEADQAAAYLAGAADKLPPVLRIEEVVKLGPMPQTLLDEISQYPRALVVMSSHGSEGFRSYSLGRITNHMLLGPSPVIVVGPSQVRHLEGLFGD